MHSVIADFFDNDVQQFVDELAAVESSLPQDAVPAFDAYYKRVKQATLHSAEACRRLEARLADDDAIREARIRFRETIQPWFDQSWFMQRARSKPRGYPGDFLLLSGIYDDVPKTTGLGGYLDLYFLNSTLAQAVKCRLAAAQRFLQEEAQSQDRPLRILNVACGPSREYTHGWEVTQHPVSVTLMDMDREALDFVEGNLADAPPHQMTHQTKVYNALRMSSAEKNVREFGRSDIIYSIGLCDYIPDNFLVRILRGWRESLAAEGVVYVAFKDCGEYKDTSYAWHVDWHFVSRTEADCRRLFSEAGYDMDRVEVYRDTSEVIMNFVCRTLDESSCEQLEVGQIASQSG